MSVFVLLLGGGWPSFVICRDEVFAGVVSISLLQVIILHSHPSILTTSTSPYPPYQHTSLSYILLPTYNVEHKIIFLTVTVEMYVEDAILHSLSLPYTTNRINKKQLIYLHRILNRDPTHWTQQILKTLESHKIEVNTIKLKSSSTKSNENVESTEKLLTDNLHMV